MTMTGPGSAVRGRRGDSTLAALNVSVHTSLRHVAEHDLGAAAYAIKAIGSANPEDPHAAQAERDWQRDRLPGQVRRLVLKDQSRRNPICWFVFSN